MSAKKNALGRGLGALIDTSEEVQPEVVKAVATSYEISVKSIEANPYQPRINFDKDSLDELVNSIEKQGIIQPLTVRKLGADKFQLISGERRLRAAKLAGLKMVPAYVRDAEDDVMLELALVENIQREDLDAIEVAISYQRLIDECTLTQETLGERVGKKRATVTNYLRLLKLPAEMQAAVRDKKMSMGQARALLGIDDAKIQMEVFEKVLEQGLSVRQVEALAKKLKDGEPEPKPKDEDASEDYENLRDHLSHFFGTAIEFKRNTKGNGRIVIPFKSDEELQRIVSILDKPGK
jgi:ParB family chromosome partitioning protein